ncbi:ALF repeat-containing protein [Streptomyces sp. NPDC090445]|uniref:ALF repeat-containing protein n=1 Tax=Streptomyces sp. NPDC090445 TaxID=3365963 RepID=UPI003830C15B
MKTNRIALALTAGALAPALLLATPALAAGPASPPAVGVVAGAASDSPYDTMSETDLRVAILRIIADPASGKGVNREAQKALNGTVEDMRRFLKTGLAIAQDEDNRVAVTRLFADPASGKAVIREATKAIEGTAADRTAFLKTGLRLARAEDDRVAITRILARPGISDALRAAVIKAIDGTPEEMRYFITTGQYEVAGRQVA